MIHDAVVDKLHINEVLSSSSSNNIIFRIADLGCSVGPNTFSAMKNIIEAVQQKYQQSQGDHHSFSTQLPEFQVFFNDHVTSDFNTLFSSLPAERPYLAAGVPGSFHDRLFPSSSLHVIHSSYAIHWLSKLPKELLDKNSPAWNQGRVHYVNAPDEVCKVYAAQFAKDMAKFLDARAKELVLGGLMVLLMPSVPKAVPFSQLPNGSFVTAHLLGSSLMDMAKEVSHQLSAASFLSWKLNLKSRNLHLVLFGIAYWGIFNFPGESWEIWWIIRNICQLDKTQGFLW